MEIKKINRLMVGIFLLHIVTGFVFLAFAEKITIGVILNLSLGQILLLAPALVYLLCWKISNKVVVDESSENGFVEEVLVRRESADAWSEPVQGSIADEMLTEQRVAYESEMSKAQQPKKITLKERLMYHKIRPSTIAYILFYVWLTMPLTTLINSTSMFFTENTVVEMTDLILGVPFPLMLFIMAVMPATIEELIFRGIAYGGYRKVGTKFMSVMLSAFLFGVMHGNLNQALYAFVLGIFLALLVEATGSLFSSMIFHFIYNAQSCCLMFALEAIQPGYYADTANVAIGAEQLFAVVSVYMVIAAVTTPLAFCLLYKIAKNENRAAELLECLPKKQTGKMSLVTPALVIATVVSVAYIIFDMVLSAMIK